MDQQDYDLAEKNLSKCDCPDEKSHVEITYHWRWCSYRKWFEKMFGDKK